MAADKGFSLPTAQQVMEKLALHTRLQIAAYARRDGSQ